LVLQWWYLEKCKNKKERKRCEKKKIEMNQISQILLAVPCFPSAPQYFLKYHIILLEISLDNKFFEVRVIDDELGVTCQ